MKIKNDGIRVGLVMVLCLGFSVSGGGVAIAQISLNLDVVRVIESSGRAKVVNPRTKATGLYQIREITLRDFNREIGMVGNDGEPLTLEDMKDPFYAGIVAEWYAGRRIPRLIKTARLPNSLLVHIACWNWGIKNTRQWHRNGARFKDLPKETRDFYEKYKRLQSKGNSGQLRPVKTAKG